MQGGFIRAFGIKGGIHVFLLRGLEKLHFRPEKDQIIRRIKINKLDEKIYYRPFSSDIDVISDFFIERQGKELQYDINIASLLKGSRVDYVLDAGANIGLFTLLYTKKYLPQKIVAVEPDKSNYDVLKKNVKLLSDTNVILKWGGVWAESSWLKVIESKMGKWGVTVEECEEKDADVKGYSVIDIMKTESIPYFDIVKMDIEGSEYYIFSDNRCEEWIKKTKIVIIELHDRKKEGCSEAVMSRMGSLGFVHISHGENLVFYRENIEIG